MGGSKKKKKRSSKNKNKGKKKSKKKTDPTTENDDIDRHRLQLIYSQLSTLKSSHKKRMESIKICSQILENPNCNASTVKFAINGFKKVFIAQLKDKKYEIHFELYHILTVLLNCYYKVYKLKNGIF